MSYYDDFDPREEERQHARMEAAMDDWYDTATKCPNCGNHWQRGDHPATRVDPAYEEQPECPECGWNEGEDPQPEPEAKPEPKVDPDLEWIHEMFLEQFPPDPNADLPF